MSAENENNQPPRRPRLNVAVPEGFDRATGVVEGRRQCDDCGKQYPVSDPTVGQICPFCRSQKTRSL